MQGAFRRSEEEIRTHTEEGVERVRDPQEQEVKGDGFLRYCGGGICGGARSGGLPWLKTR